MLKKLSRYLAVLSLCAIVITMLFMMGMVYGGQGESVSGNISTDTTWTLANSPYYVSGHVTVDSGVTLTIEPGVVVKFAESRALAVYGTLDAQGTSTDKIYFTDYRDDEAGGDTN
ncbi:hypothetical protein OMD50_00005, partial [Dethiobacter alkaliphilus]|nr:hypothetical protein [Dethiobacter alkaliphilus]